MPLFLVIILEDTIVDHHLVLLQWLINRTRFEDLNLNFVGTYYSQYTRQGVLRFFHIMSYCSNTNIQCRATFNNGEMGDSNSLTLLAIVQGEREIIKWTQVN